MELSKNWPIIKIEEEKNTFNNIKDYKKQFDNWKCKKEILIPNISKLCSCITTLNKTKERFIKGKLLFEDKNKLCILIHDPFIDGIKKFIVSKDYFFIDDTDFLNIKEDENKQNVMWMI